jgi:hypothetical protein
MGNDASSQMITTKHLDNPEYIIQRALRIQSILDYWLFNSHSQSQIQSLVSEHRTILIQKLFNKDVDSHSEYMRSYYGRIPKNDTTQQQTFVFIISFLGYHPFMDDIHGVAELNLEYSVVAFKNSNMIGVSREKTLKYLLSHFSFTIESRIRSILYSVSQNDIVSAHMIYSSIDPPIHLMDWVDRMKDKNTAKRHLETFLKATGVQGTIK